MDVEHLIECVRKHVFLYDLSHKDYKNVALKTAIWESIGRELNQNGEAVKAKWKTIRDGYTKYKKLLRGTIGSNKKITHYAWAPLLGFLDDFNTPWNPSSYVAVELTPSPPCIQTPTLESDAAMILSESTSELSTDVLSTSRIQSSYNEVQRHSNKRNELDDNREQHYPNKRKKEEYDGIDHLFLSYADTFKKFPPREQALMKLELAKLFTHTELKLLHNSDDLHSQYQQH